MKGDAGFTSFRIMTALKCAPADIRREPLIPVFITSSVMLVATRCIKAVVTTSFHPLKCQVLKGLESEL